MIKFMKLELTRNKISDYVKASIIAYIFLMTFTYFVAYVAQIENELDFQNYENILLFTVMINFIIFSILSALMYVRSIINEYTGKGISLPYYTVNGKKTLLAKILVVFLFTTIAMVLCNVITITIFLYQNPYYLS